nr:MAG TPA: hypothetical protein [Caudoviricetes sp.]
MSKTVKNYDFCGGGLSAFIVNNGKGCKIIVFSQLKWGFMVFVVSCQ